MTYAIIEREKKPKIRTPFDFEIQLEHSEQPSMTVPDQTMTIAEIMKRYATGQPISSGRDGQYFGEDDDLPDLKNLDFAEREMLLDETNQYIEETRKKMSKPKAEKNEESNEASAEGDSSPTGT